MDEHSDVDTSTASEGSNGAHPWTVVTSLSATKAAATAAADAVVSEEGEVSSPVANDLKRQAHPKSAAASPAKAATTPRTAGGRETCTFKTVCVSF